MRVLWFTNSLLPDHARILQRPPNHRGGWMAALAGALAEDDRLTLAVATNVRGAGGLPQSAGGVLYYTVPANRENHRVRRLSRSMIRAYRRVIAEFQPDVIHIHGTEYFHGRLPRQCRVACPVVVSLQGIIDVCQRHWGGGIARETWRSKRTLRDRIRRDGYREQRAKIRRRAAVEREIIAGHTAFIGRTQWDRAQLRRLNPAARYYHCDEMLRRDFYETAWHPGRMQRHRLLVSGANYPLKGFHVLLEALALLARDFPDISVRVLHAQFYPHLSGLRRFWRDCRSRGYARYLSDLIREKKLVDRIVPLSPLDAAGVAREMARAHVYVLPSLMENSSNSLAEAMLVGTPSVVSYVGGIPSLARDETSALMFPPGDEALLAEQIRRIFADDDLAVRLSDHAAAVGRRRHTRRTIVDTMVHIYSRVQGLDCPPAPSGKRLEAAMV